jgi:hypothetical protein
MYDGAAFSRLRSRRVAGDLGAGVAKPEVTVSEKNLEKNDELTPQAPTSSVDELIKNLGSGVSEDEQQKVTGGDFRHYKINGWNRIIV